MPQINRIVLAIGFVLGVIVGACVAGAIATSQECGKDVYQAQTYDHA